MAVGVNVAEHTFQLRIVGRNGAVQIDPQRFPNVGSIVVSFDLLLSLRLSENGNWCNVTRNQATKYASGEREFYYDGRKEWVFNPTAGATYQIIPEIHAGLEYWMRVEFPDNAPAIRTFNLGPHHYVGPAVMFNFGTLWWSTGIYVRADDLSHTPQIGDGFGVLWLRTVVGLHI